VSTNLNSALSEHIEALRNAIVAKFSAAVLAAEGERDRALEAIQRLKVDLDVKTIELPPDEVRVGDVIAKETTKVRHNGNRTVGTTEAIREFVFKHPGGVERNEIIDAVEKLTGNKRPGIHATVSMLERRGHLRRQNGSCLVGVNL